MSDAQRRARPGHENSETGGAAPASGADRRTGRERRRLIDLTRRERGEPERRRSIGGDRRERGHDES